VLPGGHCVNLLLDQSARCCQPDASCSCCVNLPNPSKEDAPLLASPHQHCCASIPASELNLPISINTKSVEGFVQTTGVLPNRLSLSTVYFDEAISPQSEQKHPPDLPLYLQLHVLTV